MTDADSYLAVGPFVFNKTEYWRVLNARATSLPDGLLRRAIRQGARTQVLRCQTVASSLERSGFSGLRMRMADNRHIDDGTNPPCHN
jgi:hypothetical protein